MIASVWPFACPFLLIATVWSYFACLFFETASVWSYACLYLMIAAAWSYACTVHVYPETAAVEWLIASYSDAHTSRPAVKKQYGTLLYRVTASEWFLLLSSVLLVTAAAEWFPLLLFFYSFGLEIAVGQFFLLLYLYVFCFETVVMWYLPLCFLGARAALYGLLGTITAAYFHAHASHSMVKKGNCHACSDARASRAADLFTTVMRTSWAFPNGKRWEVLDDRADAEERRKGTSDFEFTCNIVDGDVAPPSCSAHCFVACRRSSPMR